jgi:hypothetical protein
MKGEDKVFWFLFGAASLLIVKYIVVGLNDWDTALHPERIESPSMPLFFQTGILLSESDKDLISHYNQ